MFIYLLILVIGSSETAAKLFCARVFENKTLIWHEKKINTADNVKSRVWFKDGKDRVASYLNEEGIGFTEGDGYKDRLMQVGDGNLQISRVTRNDSGNYTQISRFRGVNETSKASVNLQVIDAPASICKPQISHEGSSLKAILPPEDVCATSQLSLQWKDTNKTVTTQNGTTILALEVDSGGKEFMVCAEGEATKCFQGNVSDFCTSYTVPQHEQSGDGVTPNPAYIAATVTVLLLAVIVAGLLFLLRQTGVICKRSSEEMHDEQNNIESPLIPKSNLSQIKDHLRRLNKTLTDIPVCPVGEGNFVPISDIYISLDLKQLDTNKNEDTVTMKIKDQQLPPILIVGDSGSGKTCYCKYFVHCWSQNLTMGDDEVQCLNLPEFRNFQMVLYLPLENSDQGLSFRELLQKYLFPKESCYLEFVMKYMNEQNDFQSILIVIDGLDKIDENTKLFSEVLYHKRPSCVFIFTSRPSNLKKIFDACDRPMKLFRIGEMTPEMYTTYAEKVLIIINHQKNMNLSVDNFLTFAKYLHVQYLLRLPSLCLALLFVWMENKNPHIEITDILICIMEKLLNHAMKAQNCKQKITALLQSSRHDISISINKLLSQSKETRYLVYLLSVIADAIFQTEIKRLTSEERHENLMDMIPPEVACELGFVTLESKENPSKLTFTNKCIYHFFVSMANALMKGPTFDYIMSDKDVAQDNYIIIHMLSQLLPARGRELFNIIGKQKNPISEFHAELNKNYSIKHTRERRSANGKSSHHEESVKWLQLQMYKGELDDAKLIFLTNALKFIDFLTVLELENRENKKDLTFWLPFSQTLKKLTLDIPNCTLLLCQEWNDQTPIQITAVSIRSILIHENTRDVLKEVFRTCAAMEFYPKIIGADMTKIFTPEL